VFPTIFESFKKLLSAVVSPLAFVLSFMSVNAWYYSMYTALLILVHLIVDLDSRDASGGPLSGSVAISSRSSASEPSFWPMGRGN